ncbi:hypothetical protein ACFOSC_01100 [Streptantibioticus rubrisoli]|uniref:DUF4352 domain-containing protein n=1 Tax=Streptantibioticus rubrisoli TaxID=1387313 RepID=A0ABT1PFN1_9ACTN|nr:hypothetical protein [Streptantibioticus rubrisoli]MCQ4043278.1 hypothetical protein [Streptantibioticus rubrisoli]
MNTGKAVRRLSGLAVVGALALTATACGPDNSSAQSTPSSSATSASAPTGAATPSAPSSAATGSDGTSGADTKAGQTLKMGQAAHVPFSYGTSTKGKIALTVTSIEQGNPSDLASLKLGDQAKGKVPYYIRYSVTNEGDSDLAYASVGHMKGHLGDGTEAQDLMIIGDFDKCKSDELPQGFTKGKVAQGCAVALAPSASTKVVSAEYWGEPFTLGQGITWK